MKNETKDLVDEDVTLMLSFKRGDYNAFAMLVERHQQTLIQFFYAQHPDQQLAEDCAQEVWRKVFKARNDYVARARFKTYLFRVARNYWIDVYRSKAKHMSLVSLDASSSKLDGDASLANLVQDELPTPPSLLSNEELKRKIEWALGRLPENQREVFVLAEFQGLKYHDIGEALEIPVGTVKSRMFNAMRRLRDLLSKEID